ncbi:MAG: hypothetical protein R3B91_15240 [Planctomycetaceae bacterium]
MVTALRTRIFEELESLVLIDPHTHINPHAAASTTLARTSWESLLHRAGPLGRAPAGADREPERSPRRRSGGW